MMIGAITLESLNLWPLAALLSIAVTVTVLWLYPSQVRAAGATGRFVPLLRWLAFAVLSAALLKPVLLIPKSERDLGAVAVLVDCSKSMGVIDSGRTAAEQVALAAALGRLRAGARTDVTAPVADLLARVENRAQEVLGAQSDLEYARISGRGIVEKQAAVHKAAWEYAAAARSLAAMSNMLPVGTEFRTLVAQEDQVPSEGSRDGWARAIDRINRIQAAARNLQRATDEQLYKNDPAVRSTCESLGRLSRLELAELALLDSHAGLAARIGGEAPVHAFAIDRGLQPIAFSRPDALKAEDNESDLTGALTAAMGQASGRPLRALVLFSDGRQIGGRGELTSAARPSGVPVFTVNVAPALTRDAAISSVTLSSSSAFAGETIEGQVRVRHEGVKPPSEVHIVAGGTHVAEPLAPRPSRDRRGRASDLIAHFAIPVQPERGQPEEDLVFAIAPEPGEATSANNRVLRRIKVSSDRARVIVCATKATWDFQYLRSSLSRRPWVDLDSELLDPEHPRLSLSPQQILMADVLVLDDIPVDALDVAQWDAVNRLVAAHGGTVILVAGSSYPIADYTRQAVARGLLPFHDVRPIWKQWPGEQPAFRFTPTPLGEQEALRLGDGPDGGLSRWQQLPALYRYLQIPDSALYPDVHRLLLEADSGATVLTERSMGVGRVLFLGLDETWRWRLKTSDRDSDRFWRQLVRYAAGQPYAATRGHLALDVDHVEIQPGQSVRVRARVGPGKSPSPAARVCPVEILKGGKVIGTRRLQFIGGGRFEAAISDWAPGDYELQIRGLAADNSRVAVRVPLHVAESDEDEMRNVSGNPAVLDRIARSTGGESFTLEQLDRLPQRLEARRGSEAQFTRIPLWNSPYTFTFVLACLAGEWALRKRLGLA